MDPFYSYSFGKYGNDRRDKGQCYNCNMNTNDIKVDDERMRNFLEFLSKQKDN